MPTVLFPDTTVLCNYACIDRIDLLEQIMASQGRWTQAVYAEARQSSRYWPSLNTVIDRQLLGEPIEVVDADQVNAYASLVSLEARRNRRSILGKPRPATLSIIATSTRARYG